MTDLGYSIYEQTFNSLGDDSYDHPAAKKERTPGSGSTGPAAGPGGGGLPPVWPGAVRVGNMSLVGLRGAGHGSGEEANHMPNRVIRDSILTSRQVARLDWFQQALFVRLILGCDDYGRYYGAPDIICGHLFSTSSGVTQELVAEGLGKLEEEGLIVTYQVEGETYCALPQWSKYQVCRTRREKFPSPPTEVPVQEPKIFTPQFHEAKQASIETAPEAKSAPNPIQSESEIESQSEAESESEGPAGRKAAEAAAEKGRGKLVCLDAPAAWDALAKTPSKSPRPNHVPIRVNPRPRPVGETAGFRPWNGTPVSPGNRPLPRICECRKPPRHAPTGAGPQLPSALEATSYAPACRPAGRGAPDVSCFLLRGGEIGGGGAGIFLDKGYYVLYSIMRRGAFG